MQSLVTFQDGVAAARGLLEADGGRLWGISLADVPWLAFAGDRLLATEDPGLAAFEQDGTGIWSGPKPPELRASNTAVDWAGRRWATCSLPLDPDSAVRLLVHEAWHTIQSQLLPGLAADERASDIFDIVEGRVWMRMELAALRAALTSTHGDQIRAASAALAFRHRRYQLAPPQERRRQTLLDLAEGLAEYTAWRLTGATAVQLAEMLAAPPPASWGRAFCFRTGPAYGHLLDELAPGWQFQVNATRDLQALLARAAGADVDLDPEAEAVGYGLDVVRAEETAAQNAIDEIKRRFTTNKRLRIRPGDPAKMRITFNPQLVWGNDEGTIYGFLTWSDGDGARLVADNGALMSSDWTEVWVPLGDATVDHGATQGVGWKLELPETWQIRAEGASVVVEYLS